MSTNIWFEKYAPKTIDEVILPEKLKNKLKNYIKNNSLPNLGFWSQEPGLGKSSTAKAIINTMKADALFVNASMERNIDTLRGKIFNFASSQSLSDDPKIVVMDECLEENEEVILLENNKEKCVKLNELERGKTYECLSFNLENGKFESDTCEIISDKIDDIYEVELEDGRTIKVTSNHPFIVKTKDGKFIEKSIDDGLCEDDEIVCRIDFNRIKNITKLSEGRVINLTVHRNHTFVTKNGIVTHNCDNLSKDTQSAMRGFLDQFSKNCTFIFTGNYKSKIIEPLLDRLENYDFMDFTLDEPTIIAIFTRLKYALESEGVTVDIDTKKSLVKIIRSNYPRIRNMISTIQRSVDGKEFTYTEESTDFRDIIETLKSKDYTKMITQVNSLPNPDAMYEYLYKHIELYKDLPKAILVLAKGQFQSDQVRDKNLNLAGSLVELFPCL